MSNKFIYTENREVYETLKELGFQDMGMIDESSSIKYMLGNSTDLEIPSNCKASCLLSNRMFLVAGRKGGDKNDGQEH